MSIVFEKMLRTVRKTLEDFCTRRDSKFSPGFFHHMCERQPVRVFLKLLCVCSLVSPKYDNYTDVETFRACCGQLPVICWDMPVDQTSEYFAG